MIIVGDAIHNLRASLDYVVWEMTADSRKIMALERDAKQQNRIDKGIQLPTGHCEKTFRDKTKGLRPFVSENEYIILERLEIFPNGSGAHYLALHELDIIDKHRAIVPLVAGIWISGLEERLLGWDNQETVRSLPDRYDKITADGSYWTSGRATPFMGVARLTSFSKNPYSPKIVLSNDHSIEIDLRFSSSAPFRDMPIRQSLQKLSFLIYGLINDLRGSVDK
jgi:hypothetical protein